MLKNVDPMQFVNQAKQSIKVAETVFKNESPKSQDFQLLMKIGELKMAISNFGWINDQNVSIVFTSHLHCYFTRLNPKRISPF